MKKILHLVPALAGESLLPPVSTDRVRFRLSVTSHPARNLLHGNAIGQVSMVGVLAMMAMMSIGDLFILSQLQHKLIVPPHGMH